MYAGGDERTEECNVRAVVIEHFVRKQVDIIVRVRGALVVHAAGSSGHVGEAEFAALAIVVVGVAGVLPCGNHGQE